MKASKISIVISMIIVAVLLAGTVMHFDIVWAVVMQSERVRMYEIRAMISSRGDDERNMIVTVESGAILFPLPYGAVVFENATYPAGEGFVQFLVTAAAWRHYLDFILPGNGFSYEQLGSGYFISCKNGDNRVLILNYMYTRGFNQIRVEVK